MRATLLLIATIGLASCGADAPPAADGPAAATGVSVGGEARFGVVFTE